MIEYEYVCKDCGEIFVISISSYSIVISEVKCPHCASMNVRKNFSSPHVIYKGDGFTKKITKKGSQ